MSDAEPDYDPGDDYDPDADEDEAPAGGGTTTAFGRTYADPPEGWVTASGFVKVLEQQRQAKVRPQVIFATAKNTKTFPAIHHTDGRIIVPIKEGLEWWDAKQ